MANGDINQALGMSGSPGGTAGFHGAEVNVALRYKTGYRNAQVAETMGLVLKIFGCVIAFLLFTLMMSITGSSFGAPSRIETTFLLFALLSSIMSGAMFFALGVIVSALGQQLKANLDAAVNSSPFLDVPAKARAMSL